MRPSTRPGIPAKRRAFRQNGRAFQRHAGNSGETPRVPSKRPGVPATRRARRGFGRLATKGPAISQPKTRPFRPIAPSESEHARPSERRAFQRTPRPGTRPGIPAKRRAFRQNGRAFQRHAVRDAGLAVLQPKARPFRNQRPGRFARLRQAKANTRAPANAARSSERRAPQRNGRAPQRNGRAFQRNAVRPVKTAGRSSDTPCATRVWPSRNQRPGRFATKDPAVSPDCAERTRSPARRACSQRCTGSSPRSRARMPQLRQPPQ